MVRFKISGVKVSLDFTFFAVVGLFLALDKSGYGIFCLLACFCHEAGHLVVMIIEKNPPAEIIFSGGGICIKQNRDVSTAVLAAGCVVNFCLFIIFFCILPKNSIFKLLFGGANLAIGLFNLLPIGELDGRGLMEKLCCMIFPFSVAVRILWYVQAVSCILTFALTIWLFITQKINVITIFVMIYIFLIDFFLKKSK